VQRSATSRGPRARSAILSPNNSATPRRTLSAEDKAQLQIFLVDDERSLSESCAMVLQHQGYKVSTCRHGQEAIHTLQRSTFDIVIIDLYLTPVSGMDVLREAVKANRNTIAIVITGNPTVESSLEAMSAGAWDYLPKPFSATQLEIIVGRAAHAALEVRESHESPRAIQRHHADDGTQPFVLGNSPAFRQAIDLARKVAPTDASVFITGESGAGKEVIAQFIHRLSRRSNKALVAVNCAALPEQLLESEMFGHCKGAFTGAVRDKPGLLETANGGTLFLDELIDMSKPLQAKLLRVIQDGVVRRVGSETTDAVVSVRFIAATNQDPQDALKAGSLREDLYYRLRVVPIHVPPLRKRPEEIPILANHFLAQYWARHRDGEQPPELSEAALRVLLAHPWRGNVRELQNVMEHAVVLLEPGAEVRAEDLPFLANGGPGEAVDGAVQADEDEGGYYGARDRLVAKFDRHYLARVILRAGGNLSKAARIAQIDRTTFYRMMERHGLQRNPSGDLQ